MKNPNDKMLLRIAQGDAYAMATEYIKLPRDEAVLKEALQFEHYVKHPTHALKAGMYTDDTQMSIAVAEVLLSDEPFTRKKFAQAFIDAFCRDQRDGYSRAFQAILNEAATCPYPIGHFLKAVIPNSTKNGGCMRAVPIGVLKSVDEVLEVAKVQASVTHNTAEGIWSAQAVALMSHFALHSRDPLNMMGAFLKTALPNSVTTIGVWPKKTHTVTTDTSHWNALLLDGKGWSDKVTNRWYPDRGFYGVGISTVKACYEVIQGNTNLKDMLEQIIRWGGDTDSVAAIAWGIASTRTGEANGYEDFWEWELEAGRKYGVQFLKDLGQKLMSKYVY